ncbi:hypothetical protein [Pseudoalteromonas atlantica]|uniref:hypothetical protein n=1 Tax=Pseudoalteromonas atlantica TaxID=288 RepID=UPI003A979D7F
MSGKYTLIGLAVVAGGVSLYKVIESALSDDNEKKNRTNRNDESGFDESLIALQKYASRIEVIRDKRASFIKLFDIENTALDSSLESFIKILDDSSNFNSQLNLELLELTGLEKNSIELLQARGELDTSFNMLLCHKNAISDTAYIELDRLKDELVRTREAFKYKSFELKNLSTKLDKLNEELDKDFDIISKYFSKVDLYETKCNQQNKLSETIKSKLKFLQDDNELLKVKTSDFICMLNTIEKKLAHQPVLLSETLKEAEHNNNKLSILLRQFKKSYNHFDEKLGAKLVELSSLREGLGSLKRNLSSCEDYIFKLEQFHDNSYERRKVHKACEAEFGSGKPSSLVNKFNRKIESSQRQISKIEKRISNIVKLMQRDIRVLILDGSNLCHDGGKFIGLEPLTKFLEKVSKKSYKIQLYFDHSIVHRLAKDKAKLKIIEKEYNVNICNREMEADHLILLQADDRYSFVISNDLFIDYKGEGLKVLEESRIIRFEVINSEILIPELDY